MSTDAYPVVADFCSRSHHPTRHYMVEQDIREGLQIFQLEQVFYGASGQLGESLVGGGKEGEEAFS